MGAIPKNKNLPTGFVTTGSRSDKQMKMNDDELLEDSRSLRKSVSNILNNLSMLKMELQNIK